MTKRNLTGLAVGLAVLLVAGGLFASNMGFKLNYLMDAPTNNSSKSGTNSLALPYNQQTSLVTASDLRDDINTTAGNPTGVVSITKFIRTNDGLVTYTGASEATNFTLTAGEGYRVQLNTTISFVNLIVVGSHDPAKIIDLHAPGTASSKSGTNDFAYPYHGVASNASDLRDEINTQAGVGTAVVSITRFIRTNDGLVTYTGASDATNFTLTPGESYRVQINTTVAGVGYLPQHY
jgi:hypothetical protein